MSRWSAIRIMYPSFHYLPSSRFKDINPDLLGSVVVAGGTTMMPGFVERLKDDLDRASPPGASMMASVIPHPTSHEPGYNAQRKHAPWIGGSMLGSLSSFKQVCMVVCRWISVGYSGCRRQGNLSTSGIIV